MTFEQRMNKAIDMVIPLSINDKKVHPLYKNYELHYLPHKRIYDVENDKILDIDKKNRIKISTKSFKNVNFENFIKECETQVIDKPKKENPVLTKVILDGELTDIRSATKLTGVKKHLIIACIDGLVDKVKSPRCEKFHKFEKVQ